MKNSAIARRSWVFVVAGAALWVLSLTGVATAQTIESGTTIMVRTNEPIEVEDSDGRVFTGEVDQDVLNRNGRVVIPEGSEVEMVVKNTSNNELVLDLDTIIVNNQRYGIETEDNVTTSERKEGVGANKRTGKYVGGGAILGAIIGGIAGGKKGAVIGAGAGAAAGAGVQVLTRGERVSVPAESLLTFRLEQPLRTGRGADNVSTRNGLGTAPAVRSNASIRVGSDNNVTWQGPEKSRVFVQVDNTPRKLFAEGTSGTQAASWMARGHRYVFILMDSNGNEISRDSVDLR